MLIYKCFFPVFSTMTRCFTFPRTHGCSRCLDNNLWITVKVKKKNPDHLDFLYCTLKADLKYAFLKIRGNHSEAILSAI